eukprot:CAMPEP_0174915658 /NCGR_PEP_ID=MMETSP1355-20121228/1258_1 /TAXON_ID=464990 /ORGANISM="Hemiselmis tepida, Strain CCMP443" /LENGTH=39 /DNA_ID= /DNA_START= /DNA_END= /DNA_ORIENTATION=
MTVIADNYAGEGGLPLVVTGGVWGFDGRERMPVMADDWG